MGNEVPLMTLERCSRSSLPESGCCGNGVNRRQRCAECYASDAERTPHANRCVISTDASGNIVLQEAKSSATAPLTANQAAGHPEIAQSGATVVGRRGKPPYVGGTKIPPTVVKVVRRAACPGLLDVPNKARGLE